MGTRRGPLCPYIDQSLTQAAPERGVTLDKAVFLPLRYPTSRQRGLIQLRLSSSRNKAFISEAEDTS